jgi:hypothetical protein
VAYHVLQGHSNLSKIFGGARCLQNESLRRKAKYLGLLSTTGKRQLCSANNRHPNVNSIGWQEDKCLEEEVKVRRCMHFDVADKSNGRAHHKSGPTGNPQPAFHRSAFHCGSSFYSYKRYALEFRLFVHGETE